MKDNSECPKETLCSFNQVGNYPDALVEKCEFCGKKVIYRIKDGQYDNLKYLRDHLRDTLQPHGKTRDLFIKIYGTEPIKRAKDMLDEQFDRKKLKGKREELQEYRKWLWKTQEPPKHKTKTGFQNDN